MPLVGADMARVESLRPLARIIARETGKTVKLLYFVRDSHLRTHLRTHLRNYYRSPECSPEKASSR